MAFTTSVDIANLALQFLGLPRLSASLGFNENSQRAQEMQAAYGKLKRAELRRTVYPWAIKRAVIRPIDINTMIVVPALWSSTATYFQGSIVTDSNGFAWISRIRNNTNNTPANSPSAWEAYFGPLTVGLYNSTQFYFAGELVYTAPGDGTYNVYQSQVSANGLDPSLPNQWSSDATYFIDNVVNVYPNYNASSAYLAGQTVNFTDGNVYTALSGPAWIPLIGGEAATLSADTTTEGTNNNYFYNGTIYNSFAALLTAVGGTFSRSSTAYYTNSSGTLTSASSGVLRFDYDPIALTSRGILLEGASTNLHLHSSISDSVGSYTKQQTNDTLTANAVAAPDGTTTAASFVPSTDSSQHNLFLAAGINQSAITYTYSIFAKANGYTNFQLDGTNTGLFAEFTLSGSGSVSNIQAGVTATITQLASGWYRCAVTFTGVSGNQNPIVYALGNGSVRTFVGDGASGYYFWGEQFETGAVASSYVPTTSGTATRAADNLSFPWTATTFTAFVNAKLTSEVDGSYLLDDGNGLLTEASGPLAQTSNGTNSLTTSANAYTSQNAIVVGGSSSGRVVSANGNAAASDAHALVPSAPTHIYIGQSSANGNQAFGHYTQFAFFNVAATAAQAQTLSGNPPVPSGSGSQPAPPNSNWALMPILQITPTTTGVPGVAQPVTQTPQNSPIVEWNSDTVYGIGSFALFNANLYCSLISNNSENPPNAAGTTAWVQAIGGTLYQSLVDLNINNPPATSPSQWTTSFTLGGGNQQWLQIGGASSPAGVSLTNSGIVYPIGAGPSSQSQTRNVYRCPSGYLREAPQDPKAGSTSWLGAPSGLWYNDWEHEGNYIVTRDVTPIIYRFVADVVDVSQFDDMFATGLAYRLALATASILTNSNVTKQMVAQEYAKFMGEARILGGIEAGPTEPPEDDFVVARL